MADSGRYDYARAVPAAVGATYSFAEFGPNTTTFVYPAEIFPVRVRTTSHGIAAAAGKIGAARAASSSG